MSKTKARELARKKRKQLKIDTPAPDLGANFPFSLAPSIIAGFSPIRDEINLWPLLHHLYGQGRTICLPVTPLKPAPLSFRMWTPDTEMEEDHFGVSYPVSTPEVSPDFVFVPLLAFTSTGQRLGYGGGFYDRTLNQLRAKGEVFACGVAYAGQEISALPTDEHDERLDGVLTETEFRKF